MKYLYFAKIDCNGGLFIRPLVSTTEKEAVKETKLLKKELKLKGEKVRCGSVLPRESFLEIIKDGIKYLSA